jgi:CHAT domain-containing protein/tetratricopeptide (TPR) repeat protein
LQSMPGFGRAPLRRGAAASLLFTSALLAFPKQPYEPVPDAGRRELVLLLGGFPGGARFAGFRHPALRGDSTVSARLKHRSALNKLSIKVERLIGRRPSAWTLANAGLLRLLGGKPGGAGQLFSAAATQEPTQPSLLSDLSAYYLDRADGATDKATDVALALSALERALNLRPDLLEARYNLALGLERLFLWHEAISAWKSYLVLDPDTAWSDSARDHLRRLSASLQAMPADERTLRQQVLSAALAGDGASLRKSVRHRPEVARLYGLEELLGAWALAEQRGQLDLAGALLRVAHRIGDALAAINGDRLLEESVASVEAASGGSATTLAALIRGHFLFAQGLALEKRELYAAAAERFTEAGRVLASSGTPFACLATIHLGVCRYYGAQYSEALSLLAAAAPSTSAGRYPTATGYSRWMSGVVRYAMADWRRSLADHRAARDSFASAGEWPHVAFVDSLIASDLYALGDRDQSWEYRLRALAGLPRLADPRRVYTVLWNAAEAALRDEQPVPARWFLGELVEGLGKNASPGVKAEALGRRGLVESRLGHVYEAMRDLAQARRSAVEIADSVHQSHVTADLDLAEAQVRRPGDPKRALALLDRAVAFFATAGYQLDSVASLRERAAAQRVIGDREGSARDLKIALARYERDRRSLPGEAARIAYFEQSQKVTEDMVGLQLEAFNDPASAFLYADQARARALLDSLGDDGTTRFTSPHQLERTLPRGTRLIEYAVYRDRTLAWVVSREGVEATVLPVGSRSLGRLVAQCRTAIADNAPGLPACREGYDWLIAPLRSLLGTAQVLALVPDGSLNDLPFAALQNPSSGRFLIQDYALEMAPSAAVYGSALARDRTSRRSIRSLLAVEADTFDRNEFPNLAPLRSAEWELALLRRLYPMMVALRGPAASREAVLAALPAAEVVHLSAHSVDDPRWQQRPALVLASTAARAGAGGVRRDLLTALDLMGITLPRTRVVLLAGCGTAAGPRPAEGEGTMSLARAFLSKGVPAVVATLWNVDDQATSELLGTFHQHLSRGSDALTALRRAQLEAIGQNPPVVPALWAAFQLVGGVAPRGLPRDINPVQPRGRTSSNGRLP